MATHDLYEEKMCMRYLSEARPKGFRVMALFFYISHISLFPVTKWGIGCVLVTISDISSF